MPDSVQDAGSSAVTSINKSGSGVSETDYRSALSPINKSGGQTSGQCRTLY
jgi:hypothetical protein